MATRSRFHVKPLLVDTIDQEKLWVHYDDEADSMVIYITGAPVFAVSVPVEDDTYLKVNPATGDIVGLHVEAWEQHFLPTHPQFQAAWQKLQSIADATPDWNTLLRMVALWLIFLLKTDHFMKSTFI
ncbi:MAG: DUF2283 domain-containing protein [Caldilineaceae bacterium]